MNAGSPHTSLFIFGLLGFHSLPSSRAMFLQILGFFASKNAKLQYESSASSTTEVSVDDRASSAT
jgi:hypothetical protein